MMYPSTTEELWADTGRGGEVAVRHLDISDLASVRSFAKEVLDTEKAIHVLVGTYGRGTGDGEENWMLRL